MKELHREDGDTDFRDLSGQAEVATHCFLRLMCSVPRLSVCTHVRGRAALDSDLEACVQLVTQFVFAPSARPHIEQNRRSQCGGIIRRGGVFCGHGPSANHLRGADLAVLLEKNTLEHTIGPHGVRGWACSCARQGAIADLGEHIEIALR